MGYKHMIAFIVGAILLGVVVFLYHNSQAADCSNVNPQIAALDVDASSLQSKLNDDQQHLNGLIYFGDTGYFAQVRAQWQLQYQTDANGLLSAQQGLQNLRARYPQCL